MNQNTLPQLKKRFGNLLKKKIETLNILQCIFFFIAIKELSFQTLKVKHLYMLGNLKKSQRVFCF